MTKTTKANICLLFCSAIWGFTFIAQKKADQLLDPFSFNALRFFIGCLFLYPLTLKNENKLITKEGIIAGCILFTAINIQQFGLGTTSAGNAGFITGLYVILVPLLGLFWGVKVNKFNWLGALCAVIGLYLICIKKNIALSEGDLLILISAFIWAAHVMYIGKVSKILENINLAICQCLICSILSFIFAVTLETPTLSNSIQCIPYLLFAGILSTGIAFTLQIKAQKETEASTAAVIMSFEAVFAVIGGYLLLQESISTKTAIGCTIMLCGMILAQKKIKKQKVPIKPTT